MNTNRGGPCNRWFRNLRRGPEGLRNSLGVTELVEKQSEFNISTPSVALGWEVPLPRLWAPPQGPLPSPLAEAGSLLLAGRPQAVSAGCPALSPAFSDGYGNA